MNYKIFKTDLKPWLKKFFFEKFSYIIKTITGTIITITDGIRKKVNELKLSKESSQDATPSPENPVPVNVVEGYRNLWDFNNQNFVNQSLFSISRTSDGIIFTSTGSGYAFAQSSIVLEAGTYNFNYIIENGSVKTSGNNYSDSKIFTLTETTTVYFRVYKSEAVSGDTITLKNISLYKGTSLLPDIPYGNNYVNVEVASKNLLNWNNCIENKAYNNDGELVNNTVCWACNTRQPIRSNSITLSIDFPFTQGTQGRLMCFNDNDVQTETYSITSFPLTINFNQNSKYYVYYFVKSLVPFNSKLQIEKGSVATSYEPYVSTNAQIPLNGNYVAGIGNYKDEIIVDKNGHCWLNKKTGKVVLDGSESGWSIASSSGTRVVYERLVSDIVSYTNGQIIPDLLSNRFTPISYNGTWKIGNVSRWTNRKSLVLIVEPNISTTEDFKTWLSTHNTDVYYVLAEENLIDLNYTVDIRLFNGVNNISNSDDMDMAIKYYSK